VLGADAGVLLRLRELAPGTLLVCQQIEGRVEDVLKSPAELERVGALVGRRQQLTHLLYPDPFLVSTANAIDVVEDLTRRGQVATLCVMPGDPAPIDRKGWTRATAVAEFETWQFRTE
jgi:hypothetical protein